ncbi:MAG: tetratricopeptide repeat protein, partial [Candidatus Acidiferrales bacterium]
MDRAPDQRITGTVGQEICLRENIKAMMTGQIAPLGSRYVLTLNAVNCATGDSLAREQVEAASKEEVLSALGSAASRLRGKLGESLASIEALDTPLEQATTTSLQALKALSLGDAKRAQGPETDSIPFYRRVLELDPNFALAYARLGTIYGNIGEREQAEEFRRKAFELRDRVSERERLYITAHYYTSVTFEIEKARQTYELWTQTYPRDSTPRNNLGAIYGQLGRPERALTEFQEALRLNPREEMHYRNVAGTFLTLNRLEEAKAVAQRQLAELGESTTTHVFLYRIAAAQGDHAAMERHVAGVEGSAAEADLLGARAEAALFVGKLAEARRLSRQQVELRQRQGLNELAASIIAGQGGAEALVGNRPEARTLAREALAMDRGITVLFGATVALVMAGDADQAEKLFQQWSPRVAAAP